MPLMSRANSTQVCEHGLVRFTRILAQNANPEFGIRAKR